MANLRTGEYSSPRQNGEMGFDSPARDERYRQLAQDKQLLERKLAELKKQVDGYRRENEALKLDSVDIQADLRRSNDRIRSMEEQARRDERVFEELEERLADASEENLRLREELQMCTDERDVAVSKLREQNKAKFDHDGIINEQMQRLEALRAENTEIDSHLQGAKRALEQERHISTGLNMEIQSINENLMARGQEVQDLVARNRALEEQMMTLRIQTVSKESYDSLAAQVSQTALRLERTETERETLRKDSQVGLSQLENQLIGMRDQQANLVSRYRAVVAENKQLQKDVDTNLKRYQGQTGRNMVLSEELTKMEDEVREKMQTISEKDFSIQEKADVIRCKLDEIELLREELREYEMKSVELEMSDLDLKTQIDSLVKAINVANDELSEKKEDSSRLKSEIEKLTTTNNAQKADLEQMSIQYLDLIDRLQREAGDITKAQEAVRNATDKGKY
ncbi:hypothetical protein SARC_07236 [Sphaeroforma arctica JP610]|uniref:Paramyosin n=1 Tax=Sphaeroforma arctica JP610 TaxID=667725 RepID=A0A0L0FUA4_9EUKA|nr:hypothetical protein SARC_07236 [Sphaeroforma arctica JP610]KNC80407.1 hypothetical protein SARC_07236 [Sphaeroforma arctica JP610]|eukprot:XP_014154309.1 hypothetical protein SARC_07236 [Sphaeroforma arctica JP610]